MLRNGAVVGNYRVEAYIATGAMGEVYRVLHTEHGTRHALKYLPLANSRIRRRLMREAEMQMRLSHPNVVTLTEVIEVKEDPGLIMEFVDGPSLARWLEGRLLTVPEAVSLFQGMVQGVAHAHRKGLVHRDLKPSNVLLARTPEGLVPKVADFGIAKALVAVETGNDDEKLTYSGASLGSPAYMSPEQVADAHEVDPRADIFSLGSLLYEMVCGERAFPGKEALAVLNAVVRGAYEPPESLNPDIPDYVGRAIRRCLEVDTARRFQTCEELLDVLAEGTEATPIRVMPRFSDDVTDPSAPPPGARPALGSEDITDHGESPSDREVVPDAPTARFRVEAPPDARKGRSPEVPPERRKMWTPDQPQERSGEKVAAETPGGARRAARQARALADRATAHLTVQILFAIGILTGALLLGLVGAWWLLG